MCPVVPPPSPQSGFVTFPSPRKIAQAYLQSIPVPISSPRFPGEPLKSPCCLFAFSEHFIEVDLHNSYSFMSGFGQLNMFLSFIHVEACIIALIFLPGSLPLYGWTTLCLSIDQLRIFGMLWIKLMCTFPYMHKCLCIDIYSQFSWINAEERGGWFI